MQGGVALLDRPLYLTLIDWQKCWGEIEAQAAALRRLSEIGRPPEDLLRHGESLQDAIAALERALSLCLAAEAVRDRTRDVAVTNPSGGDAKPQDRAS